MQISKIFEALEHIKNHYKLTQKDISNESKLSVMDISNHKKRMSIPLHRINDYLEYIDSKKKVLPASLIEALELKPSEELVHKRELPTFEYQKPPQKSKWYAHKIREIKRKTNIANVDFELITGINKNKIHQMASGKIKTIKDEYKYKLDIVINAYRDNILEDLLRQLYNDQQKDAMAPKVETVAKSTDKLIVGRQPEDDFEDDDEEYVSFTIGNMDKEDTSELFDPRTLQMNSDVEDYIQYDTRVTAELMDEVEAKKSLNGKYGYNKVYIKEEDEINKDMSFRDRDTDMDELLLNIILNDDKSLTITAIKHDPIPVKCRVIDIKTYSNNSLEKNTIFKYLIRGQMGSCAIFLRYLLNMPHNRFTTLLRKDGTKTYNIRKFYE